MLSILSYRIDVDKKDKTNLAAFHEKGDTFSTPISMFSNSASMLISNFRVCF